ncbi:MAG TPA: methionine synthase, partial [Firmicutes bacterium]|nr:methionine synthase [Bacillota bacterium]
GGCCGTTPQHIRLLRNAVEGLIPGDGTGTCSGGTAGAGRAVTGLASRSQAVLFTEAAGPVIIGERINPTGRKQLAEDIRRGSFAVVRRDAKAQV